MCVSSRENLVIIVKYSFHATEVGKMYHHVQHTHTHSLSIYVFTIVIKLPGGTSNVNWNDHNQKSIQ